MIQKENDDWKLAHQEDVEHIENLRKEINSLNESLAVERESVSEKQLINEELEKKVDELMQENQNLQTSIDSSNERLSQMETIDQEYKQVNGILRGLLSTVFEVQEEVLDTDVLPLFEAKTQEMHQRLKLNQQEYEQNVQGMNEQISKFENLLEEQTNLTKSEEAEKLSLIERIDQFELYEENIQSSEFDSDKLNEEILELRKIVEERNQKVFDSENEIKVLNKKIEELSTDTELDMVIKERDNAQQELDLKISAIGELEKEKEALSLSLEEKAKSLDVLNSEKEKNELALLEKEQHIEELQERFNNLTILSQENQTDINSLKKEKDQYIETIENQEKEIISLMEERKTLNESLEKKQNELDDLSKELEANSHEKDPEANDMNEILKEKEELIQKLHDEIVQYTAQIDGNQNNIEDLETMTDPNEKIMELNQLIEKNKLQTEEIDRLEKENEQLIIISESKENQISDLEEEIKKANSGILEREQDINRLNDIIDSFKNNSETDTLSELTGKNEMLEEEIKKIDSRLSQKEEELIQAIEERDQLKKALSQEEKELTQIVEEKNQLQKDLKFVTNERDHSQSMLAEQKNKVEEIEKENKENQKLLSANEMNIEKLNNEIEEKNRTIGNMKKNIESLQENVAELEDKLVSNQANGQAELLSNIEMLKNISEKRQIELQEYKEMNEKLENRINDLKTEVKTKEERITELTNMVELKEQLLIKSESRNQELVEIQSSMQEKLDLNEQTISDLEIRLSTLQEKLTNSEREVKDLQETAMDTSDLEETIKESNSRMENIRLLEEQNNKLKTKLTGLRDLLQRAQNHIGETKQALTRTENELASEKAKSLKISQSLGKLQLNQENEIEQKVSERIIVETEKLLQKVTDNQIQKEGEYESKINELNLTIETLQNEYESYKRKAQSLVSSNQSLQSAPVSEDNEDIVMVLKSRIVKLKDALSEKETLIKKFQSDSDNTESTVELLKEKERKVRSQMLSIEELRNEVEEKEQLIAKHLDTIQELQIEVRLHDKNMQQHKVKTAKEIRDLNQLVDEKNRLIQKLETSKHNYIPPDNTGIIEDHKARIKELETVIEKYEQAKNFPMNTPIEPEEKEDPFFAFASLQRQKENELNNAKELIAYYEAELSDAQKMNDLHIEQELVLKEVIRSLQQQQQGDTIDIYTLKNTILALVKEPNTLEKHLPVLSLILNLTEDEKNNFRAAVTPTQSWTFWR
eukprot:TRINITY_DN5100_c0_g1_i1.p1 TRINITY_DN5100_c0_g1~~TRINITY_DN5100_c0_g1_i1.p1  ORF type:complete len:1386 (-),score=438.16 TRINITY_DN5100_c0_g1_i1:27-3689(-)